MLFDIHPRPWSWQFCGSDSEGLEIAIRDARPIPEVVLYIRPSPVQTHGLPLEKIAEQICTHVNAGGEMKAAAPATETSQLIEVCGAYSPPKVYDAPKPASLGELYLPVDDDEQNLL